MKFIKVVTPSGEMYVNIQMIISFQYFPLQNYTLMKIVGRGDSIIVQGDLALRLAPDDIQVVVDDGRQY